MTEADKSLAARLTKAITVLCVRNTFLEDLHSGTSPSTATGDYSDVKVVTPYGEIPWKNLSRLNDEEMKCLMKEIVNKIYTFLCRQEEEAFVDTFVRLGSRYAARWDEPELERDFVIPVKAARKRPRPRRDG